MEEESWRRNRGGGIMEGSIRGYLGGICGASGRHLGALGDSLGAQGVLGLEGSFCIIKTSTLARDLVFYLTGEH